MRNAPEDMQATLARLQTAQAPAHMWSRIDARLRNGDIVMLPLEDPASPRIRSPKYVAAALVVLLASGAAAAVAFDAFREWRRDRAVTGVPAETVQPDSGPVSNAAIPAVVLLIEPDDAGRLRVEFVRPAPDLRLRVVLTDAEVMELTTTGAARAAHFRSGRGHIVITDAAGGEVLLKVPRGTVMVDVTVDDRELLSKRGASVRLMVPADTSGAEIILPVR